MSDKVLTENDLEDSLPATAKASHAVEASVIPPTKQKINNVQQKEDAMHYLGLTRKKYLLVICEALEAVIEIKKRDANGNEHIDYEPDFDKRKWGAEQAAKLFGDYIQHVDANVKVTHSVEELLNIFDKAKVK